MPEMKLSTTWARDVLKCIESKKKQKTIQWLLQANQTKPERSGEKYLGPTEAVVQLAPNSEATFLQRPLDTESL